jgi:hypothetical protein
MAAGAASRPRSWCWCWCCRPLAPQTRRGHHLRQRKPRHSRRRRLRRRRVRRSRAPPAGTSAPGGARAPPRGPAEARRISVPIGRLSRRRRGVAGGWAGGASVTGMRLGTRRGFPRRRLPCGEEGSSDLNPRLGSVRVEREAPPSSSTAVARVAWRNRWAGVGVRRRRGRQMRNRGRKRPRRDETRRDGREGCGR